MSQCTAENLTRTTASPFNPNNPNENRDACADLVRKGWGPDGLYRGDYGMDARGPQLNDTDFIVEMKAAFLGGDPEELFADVSSKKTALGPYRADAWKVGAYYDPYESIEYDKAGGHRTLGANLGRLRDYLEGPGLSITEIPRIIIPKSEDGVNVEQAIDVACETIRKDSLRTCTAIALYAIDLVANPLGCLADHAACTGGTLERVWDRAMDTCGCPATFWGVEIPGVCEATCGPIAFGIYLPLEEAACTLEHFGCDLGNLPDLINPHTDEADDLLESPKAACDTFDEARSIYQCLDADQRGLTPEQKRKQRRECIGDICQDYANGQEVLVDDKMVPVDKAFCTDMWDRAAAAYDDFTEMQDAIARLTDQLKDPVLFMNVAFLYEDLREQPDAWGNELRDALGENPEDDNEAAWKKLNSLIDRAQAGGLPLSADKLFDIADMDDLTELIGLIDLRAISSLEGPTVKRVLADIGNDFADSFTPFFNTVQGLKLGAMVSMKDIVALHRMNGVSTKGLPSRSLYARSEFSGSEQCDNAATSIFCDVLRSFDDPACIECEEGTSGQSGAVLDEMYCSDGADRVPDRGLISYQPFDGLGGSVFTLTHFSPAATEEAFGNVYANIFRMGDVGVPEWASFEDVNRPWTIEGRGGVGPDYHPIHKFSSAVSRCETKMTSPEFTTTEWGTIGDELHITVQPWMASALFQDPGDIIAEPAGEVSPGPSLGYSDGTAYVERPGGFDLEIGDHREFGYEGADDIADFALKSIRIVIPGAGIDEVLVTPTPAPTGPAQARSYILKLPLSPELKAAFRGNYAATMILENFHCGPNMNSARSMRVTHFDYIRFGGDNRETRGVDF